METRQCNEMTTVKKIKDFDYSKELYLLINDIYIKTKIPFVIIIDEFEFVL